MNQKGTEIQEDLWKDGRIQFCDVRNTGKKGDDNDI